MADALPNHYWIQSLLITKVSLGFSSVERKQQVFLHSPLKSFFLSINSYEVVMLMLPQEDHVSFFPCTMHFCLGSQSLVWITACTGISHSSLMETLPFSITENMGQPQERGNRNRLSLSMTIKKHYY